MQRPRIEFCPVDRRNKRSVWLRRYARNVTSQAGEDGIIEKIFEVIGEGSRFCVDFGGSDGKTNSNTYNLIANRGWSGVLIEPSIRFEKLARLYGDHSKVHLIKDMVGFDEHNKLDAHLSRCPFSVPVNPDFVSIDIDGCDIYVWEDIKLFRPRVVCIEFNGTVALDVYLLQPQDFSVNVGSSLLATQRHASQMGYELIATTRGNAFFVLQPLYEKFRIRDNSVQAMHFLGQMETKIAHGYDGALYLAGLDHNPWRGYKIDEERIQILPSNLRQWKFNGRAFPRSAKDLKKAP